MLIVAVEEMRTEKVDLFMTVSLSVETVTYRVEEIRSKITCHLKNKAKDSEWVSLALDEPTGMSNTLELLIFIRGVIAKF